LSRIKKDLQGGQVQEIGREKNKGRRKKGRERYEEKTRGVTGGLTAEEALLDDPGHPRRENLTVYDPVACPFLFLHDLVPDGDGMADFGMSRPVACPFLGRHSITVPTPCPSNSGGGVGGDHQADHDEDKHDSSHPDPFLF